MNRLIHFWRILSREGLRALIRSERFKKKFKSSVEWRTEMMDGVQVTTGTLANGKTISLANVFGEDKTSLSVLRDAFRKGCYNFSIRGESVVIDIGMNTGIVALSFAMRDDIVAIYGFEPVPATYQKALVNFGLNPFSDKIVHRQCGLGDSEKEVSIWFDSAHSGGASMISDHGENQVTVKILDAEAEIGGIIRRHEKQNIVIKCDAEGAEKEIIGRLDETGCLTKIDMLIMEYHFGYDRFIEPILLRNGFALFGHVETKTGLIHAVKWHSTKLVTPAKQ